MEVEVEIKMDLLSRYDTILCVALICDIYVYINATLDMLCMLRRNVGG